MKFAALLMLCLPAFGQSAKPAPRAPDGKPDLSGFWQGPLLRNMERTCPEGSRPSSRPPAQRRTSTT